MTSTDTSTGNATTTTVNHRVTSPRLLFDASSTTKPYELTPGNNLTLQLTSDFKQTDYRAPIIPTSTTSASASADTQQFEYAQYVLQENSTLAQRLGTNSNINVQYSYLRPYGAVPTEFRFDQAGSNNNITTNLQVTGDRIKYTVGTATTSWPPRKS